jgi:hypothetical protein
MNRQELIDAIVNDWINHNIYEMEMIRDLVQLLDDSAVEQFATMYEYSSKQTDAG